MAAPLIAAASYFGLPRLLGSLADQAMSARYDSLQNRGVSPSSDTLYNLLSLVPRQSGLESTLQDFDYLRTMGNMPITPVPDIQGQPGYHVTRELPHDQGVVFNTPMDDFLKYGGRDADAGERYFQAPSYGQTDQPATEVRFDNPSEKPNMSSSGFAGGGIVDVLNMIYAQRQR